MGSRTRRGGTTGVPQFARLTLLKLTLVSLFISGASAAVNVFSLRDYVAEWPTGTFLMTCGLMLLTIGMELSFHKLEHSLTNRYAKDIYHHISGELKMLGILSLGIVASQNFLPNTDAHLPQLLLHLFEWAHMVLFVFALLLVSVVAIFFGSIRVTWLRWVSLEKEVLQRPELLSSGLDSGPGKNFYRALRQFRKQIGEVDDSFKDISFCRYLKKKQRGNLQYVVCMNWKSWLALIAIAGLNFCRGQIVNIKESWGSDEEKEACQLCPQMKGCQWRHSWPWNVVLYISMVGYFPLFFFFAQTWHLYKNYREYLKGAAGGGVAESERTVPLLEDSNTAHPGGSNIGVGDNSRFFWKSADFELQLIQWSVVFQIYYLSVHLLSMTMECLDTRSGRQGEGAILFLAGLTPPFLFISVCPTAMQCMTVLSATGNLLDREVLQAIHTRDEADITTVFHEANDNLMDSDDEKDSKKPSSNSLQPKYVTNGGSFLPTTPAALPDISSTLNTERENSGAQPSFTELMMQRAQQKAGST